MAICWAEKCRFFRIFEMSKSCQFFLTPQISEFWAINWHRCVTTCKLTELFFLGSSLWVMAAWVIGHFGLTHKLSIYGMKVQQFWCNVIWKFVEDLFTYHEALFGNFCDLRFSHKSRLSDIFLGGCCMSHVWVGKSKLIWVVNLMVV